MTRPGTYQQLLCPNCQRSRVIGVPEMLARLRRNGKLRRAREPDVELILELFAAELPALHCEDCDHLGLTARPAGDPGDDQAWGEARRCEVCRAAIPAERIALFSDVKRCVACQANEERGQSNDTPEYCPRCGGELTLKRASGSGLARYVMFCEGCGR